MFAYWLWTSRKVGSHFADSEQVKKLVVILLALNESKNLVVILLLIVGHGCLLNDWTPLFMLICQNIFSFGVAVLKCVFWEKNNFEVYSYSEKNFFQHKATVSLNLVSDRLLVKAKKTKIQSIFYIFNFVITLLIY